MINALSNYEGFNITFHVTEECNLRCAYCYELNKNPRDLPLEYAYRFIDLILQEEDPAGLRGTKNEWILNHGLVMDFIGGDPLMRIGKCEEIIRYFIYKSIELNHRWASRWRISMSTNGTLFNEPGVKDFLMTYKDNISLGVSVDGMPKVHNMNRSNSMNDVLMGWAFYKRYAGDMATTKSTLNSLSIPYIYESVKYLHEKLGLKYIYMNFIFEEMTPVPDLKELELQLEKTVYYVLEHKDDLYLSLFDKTMGAGQCMKDPDTGWCGSGAMPCLDINGNIYPCFRFCPQNMEKKSYDFSVGDVWHGFNKKNRFGIVRDQTREKISPKMCFECEHESACAWCIASSFAESGKFYRQVNICEVNKIQSRWAKKYWELCDDRRKGG